MGAGSPSFSQKVTIDVGMKIDDVKSKAKELQNTFGKFELKGDMAENAKKAFEELFKELNEYTELANKGAENEKEGKAIEDKWKRVANALEKVNKLSEKISTKRDVSDLVPKDAINKANELKKALENIKPNAGEIDKYKTAIKDAQEEQTELNTKIKDYKELLDAVKNQKGQKEIDWSGIEGNSGYKGQISKLFKEGDQDFGKVQEYIDSLIEKSEELGTVIDGNQKKIDEAKASLSSTNPVLQKLRKAVAELTGKNTNNLPWDPDKLINVLVEYQQEAEKTAKINQQELATSNEKLGNSAKDAAKDMEIFSNQIAEMANYSKQIQQLTTRLMQFFSLTNGFNLLTRAVRQAFTAIKELDQAFTEIAVVSKYSVDEVWSMRSNFVQAANDIGASTNDLVEATTLYVQQGLSLEEAQKIAVETMKMGRIANLDGKDATDLMTAAVRGYRMELTDANHVNDVYSNLAAHSASNTRELATAMSKTASTAYTSGASFENMSAFLAQIIETTREAPETAGTAMKTIISRFQELKEATTDIVDVDGEEVSVNRVEKALKTAGVALRDAKGEFRAFDDVILELASKWDTLDIMTQRYIATQTAGARQQSRFLALMNNYDRLVELTGYAMESAGASNEQFEKTMDSLQASLNQLKNAWNLFLTGFANNKVITLVVDLLTQLLNGINAIFAPLNQADNILANILGSLLQLGAAIIAFVIVQKSLLAIVQKVAAAAQIAVKSKENDIKATVASVKAKFADILATKQETKALLEQAAVREALEAGFDANEAAIYSNLVAKEMDAGITEVETQAELAEAAASGVASGANELETVTILAKVKARLKNIGTMLLEHWWLLAIAIAIIALVAAYKVYQNSIHKARKTQEDLNKELDKTREKTKELKDGLDDLNSSLDNIAQDQEIFSNLSEGSQEWYDQLVKINDEVLELIKNYPELAQYLETGVNGELTLSEQGVEEYKQARKDEIRDNQIKETVTQYKIASLDPSVMAEDYFNESNIGGILKSSYQVSTQEWVAVMDELRERGQTLSDLSAEEIDNLFKELGIHVDASSKALASGMPATIGKYLSGVADDPELMQVALKGNASDQAAVKAFSSSLFTAVTDGMEISDENKALMKTLFGEELNKAIADGIDEDKMGDYLTGRMEEISGKVNTLRKNNRSTQSSKALGIVQDIYSGKTSIADLDIDIKEVLAAINDPDKILEQMGITEEVLVSKLSDIQKADQENQQRLLDLGMLGGGRTLSAENREGMVNLLNASGMTEEMQQVTAQAVYTDKTFEKMKDTIEGVDFTDPIESFAVLSEAMESGDLMLENWAKDMKAAGAGSLGKGLNSIVNQLNTAEESLSDIVKTEGKISADKVKELAQQNASLAKIMDLGILTAEQLADILTHVGEGGAIEGYTDRVLELISGFDTVEKGYQDMMDAINSYEEGNDEGQGLDFLKSRLESIEGHIDNYEYGNSQVKNALEFIFTADDITASEASIDKYYSTLERYLEDEGLGFWEEAAKIGEFTNKETGKALTITDLGNGDIDLDFDPGMGYSEMVQAIADGMGITAKAANMFLQDMAQHNLKLAQEIKDAEIVDGVKQQVKAFEEGGKKVIAFTDAEVEALKRAGAWEEIQKQFTDAKGIVLTITTVDEDGNPKSPLEIYNNINSQLPDGETLSMYFKPTFVDDEEGAGVTALLDYASTKEKLMLEFGVDTDTADQIIQGWIDQDPENRALTLGITDETYQNVEDVAGAMEEATETSTEQMYADAKEATASGIEDGGTEGWNTVIDYVKNNPPDADVTLNYTDAVAAFRRHLQAAAENVNVSPRERAKGSPPGGESYSGIALVGEKGYELYQSEDGNYARLVGLKGPELMYLNKGDRIYSNPDTKSMMRGGIIPRYSVGHWKKGDGDGSGSGSGPGSGSGSKDDTDAWIAAYDWLYNLVQKTNEEIRRGNKLEHERQKLLRNGKNDAEALLKIYQQQMESLKLQQQYWQEQHDKRLIEAQQIEDKYADLMQYAHYDENLGYVVIDWDLINSVSGQEGNNELGERIDDYIKELEEIQDKIDDTEDALMDIEDQIYELEQEGRDQYEDLEQRVIDALKAQRQEAIDNAQELSDTIRDTNSQLLDRISSELDDYRKQRDMDEKQSDIESMERRLALLQSDTSGANDLEILKLQEEIDNARQDYTDELIDQAIEDMTKQNEEAYEQRQKQIDLMQAQLDWDYESGRIALKADEIIIEAMMNPEGIKNGWTMDKIADLLKEYEEYYEKGVVGRDSYDRDFTTISEGAEAWWMDTDDVNKTWYKGHEDYDDQNRILFDIPWIKGKTNVPAISSSSLGVPTIGIKDLAPETNTFNKNTTTNSIYYNINMNNKVASDYDVDQIWDQMKQKINEEAMYRNTVALDFGRR